MRKLVVNSVIILKCLLLKQREVIDWIGPADTRDGEFLVYVSICWHPNDLAPWSD